MNNLAMNYKMSVTIESPNKDEHETYNLDCVFFHDDTDYGNGYYLSIDGDKVYGWYYDLRYDTSFKSNEKVNYLKKWANAYWSGNNGAWHITDLIIKEAW